jgi:DNA-binding CsgD family transcriptional regulator
MRLEHSANHPANRSRSARPGDGGPSAREVARAEGCLRAFLAWVGAPPTERKSTAVAKVVNEILNKDPAVVYAALRRVALTSAPTDLLTARYQLTRREAEVARQLALGKSNAEIAEALSISEHTARRHTEQVLLKLGVRSRAAVAPLLAEVTAEAPRGIR